MRGMRRAATIHPVLLSLCFVACGDEVVVLGTPGEWHSVLVTDWRLLTEASLDGAEPISLLVDTGANDLMIDRREITDPPYDDSGVLESIATVGLVFENVPMRTPDVEFSKPDADYRGLLGGVILSRFAVSIDYPRSQMAFDAPEMPGDADLIDDVAIALEGEQGHVSRDWALDPFITVRKLPATDVIVNVDIEGHILRLLLDTGSPATILRTSWFDILKADGRQTVPSPMRSMYAAGDGEYFQIRSLAVGNAIAVDTLGAAAPIFDELLDMTGKDLDGIIGHAFLKQFLVTIDYPQSRLRFHQHR